MKKAILLVIIVLGSHYAFGQGYIVTYLKGNIYHDHKLIKLHDRLDGVTSLTSDDRNSEIALFSIQKGKFRLTFQNSKPVVAVKAEKKSELFQLVVESYIMSYTTEKTLTTRGDFDLKSFFNENVTKDSNRIFLMEGESLPAKSTLEPLHTDDKFSICVINGKDTVCTPIKRTNSYLVFDEQLEKPFNNDEKSPSAHTCIIKHEYAMNGNHQQENFSEPVMVTFLSKSYLSALVKTFSEGLDSYYKGDKNKMMADVQDQLNFYYGRNFTPAVQQVLKSY
jgi:hypothetical protein